MTMALDIGTTHLRSITRCQDRLVVKSSPVACCYLPDKPPVRHLLNRSEIPFSSTGEQLVIWGSSAEKLSKQCAVKTEHLLARNPLRKDNRSISDPLKDLLSTLLPTARKAGEVCSLGTISDNLHGDWLRSALVSRGYHVAPCSAGKAVVLAELVREQFTGIGMVLGASRCEAVLVKAGQEIARCELPRGGMAIDQNLAIAEERYWWSMAGFRELETEGITQWKETLTTSILEPETPRGERLLNGYHQMMAELCAACETAFDRQALPQSLALVVGGGAVRVPGFSELLNHHLAESSLPIDPTKTKITGEESTILRGLLIQAELEKRQRGPIQSRAA